MTDQADWMQYLTRAATTNQPLLTGMGSPGGPVSLGQGRILTWNSSTFENTVAYRGGVLQNLPVLSGPDALTYKPDDIVSIMSWSPNGGAASHWIQGRVIYPGPGKGAEAIAWMTSELGRRLAAAVFAERIKTQMIEIQGSLTTENTWVNSLSVGGSPSSGPSVQADISESGKALVFVSSLIQNIDGESAYMSFRIDGATNPPIGSVSAFLRSPAIDGDGVGVSSTGIGLVSGLSQGLHTFAAAYRASNVTNPFGVTFSDRIIVVMGL